jgi:hypothetical protein
LKLKKRHSLKIRLENCREAKNTNLCSSEKAEIKRTGIGKPMKKSMERELLLRQTLH